MIKVQASTTQDLPLQFPAGYDDDRASSTEPDILVFPPACSQNFELVNATDFTSMCSATLSACKSFNRGVWTRSAGISCHPSSKLVLAAVSQYYGSQKFLGTAAPRDRADLQPSKLLSKSDESKKVTKLL